jgi:hypothetical protein
MFRFIAEIITGNLRSRKDDIMRASEFLCGMLKLIAFKFIEKGQTALYNWME